jgi:hypothetical protein
MKSDVSSPPMSDSIGPVSTGKVGWKGNVMKLRDGYVGKNWAYCKLEDLFESGSVVSASALSMVYDFGKMGDNIVNEMLNKLQELRKSNDLRIIVSLDALGAGMQKWWCTGNPFKEPDMCHRCFSIPRDSEWTEIDLGNHLAYERREDHTIEVHMRIHAPSANTVEQWRQVLVKRYNMVVFMVNPFMNSCLRYVCFPREAACANLLTRFVDSLAKAIGFGLSAMPYCFPLSESVKYDSVRKAYSIYRYAVNNGCSAEFVLDALEASDAFTVEYEWNYFLPVEEFLDSYSHLRKRKDITLYPSSLSYDFQDRKREKFTDHEVPTQIAPLEIILITGDGSVYLHEGEMTYAVTEAFLLTFDNIREAVLELDLVDYDLPGKFMRIGERRVLPLIIRDAGANKLDANGTIPLSTLSNIQPDLSAYISSLINSA